jgi:hypothetical protein
MQENDTEAIWAERIGLERQLKRVEDRHKRNKITDKEQQEK